MMLGKTTHAVGLVGLDWLINTHTGEGISHLRKFKESVPLLIIGSLQELAERL